MKRYIITSPYFKGRVDVTYDETGLLCKLDATMLIESSAMHVEVLKVIPVCEWNIPVQVKRQGIEINEIVL